MLPTPLSWLRWFSLALLAAAQAPAQAPPASAPFLDSGPQGWRDRTYDLLHLDFDLTFDLEARTVRGTATSHLTPIVENLREISFDAEGLTVAKATVGGEPAPFRAQGAKLFVGIPRAAKPGEKLVVAIEYSAAPTTGLHWSGPEPGYEWKTRQCYSQGEAENNHYWLPVHDYPNDRATWSCTLHVANDLTAVSNGKFLGVTPDVGAPTRAFRYAMEQPNVSYLISVAIGPWERWADEWRGIPVEYFVAKGTGEERARRSFGRTPEMLEFFSEWIGSPYPWAKYAQTTVAEFVVGGMENVSATTQTDLTLHDERAHLERDSEGLVAHELAHQWWGDWLTCNGWRHLWLNEGFATYFTALWFEKSQGLDAYRLYMDGQRRSFLAADPEDAPRSLVTTPANRRGEGANAHVYTKGSSVLHMLRFVVGDDAFRQAIGVYGKRHALGLVETRDLERAVSDVTGRGLEWFWQEWAYLQGAPTFEVSSTYDAETRVAAVTVKQVQKTSALVPLFKTPVDLLLGFPGGHTETKRVWIENAEHRFEFETPQAPAFVRFDEGSWIAARVKHERTVEALAAQAAMDPDVVGRKEACERLGEKLASADDPRAVEALSKALASLDHKDVRAAAAAALRNGKSAAARAALRAALSDKDANVRRAAAESLGVGARDEETVAALQRALESDVAYGVRGAAVRSLGSLLGADGWDLCAAAARQTSERDAVRVAAMDALKKIDPLRAVDLLLEAAKVGESYDARDRALSLLVSCANDKTAGPKIPAERRAAIREALLAAGGSNNWRLRLAAMRLMGQLDDPELAPFLEKASKESRDGRDRRTADGAIAARKSRDKPAK